MESFDIHELVNAALREPNPSMARDAFYVVWRHTQLQEKNTSLERLARNAPEASNSQIASDLTAEYKKPRAWNDDFETKCAEYVRECARGCNGTLVGN